MDYGSAPETAVRKWNLERYARLTSVIIGKEIAQGKDGWEVSGFAFIEAEMHE